MLTFENQLNKLTQRACSSSPGSTIIAALHCMNRCSGVPLTPAAGTQVRTDTRCCQPTCTRWGAAALPGSCCSSIPSCCSIIPARPANSRHLLGSSLRCHASSSLTTCSTASPLRSLLHKWSQYCSACASRVAQLSGTQRSTRGLLRSP